MDTVRSADGTRIAFERIGDGPPLLVVNGALSDHTSGIALARALEAHVTVIVFDRRGRGMSGDTAPYAVERELEDLAALAETIGAPVDVFGHSSGGTLTLRAATAGLPVRRVAVHEPPFILEGSRPRPPGDLAGRLESLVSAGDREAAVRTFLREGPGLPDAAIDVIRSSPAWVDMVALAHTLAFDAMITGDCALPGPAVAGLPVPVLVLRGGTSPEWMRAGTEALAAAVPNGELRVIEGHGHGGPSSAPDLVARELLGFLTA